jgi:hypothetical protein
MPITYDSRYAIDRPSVRRLRVLRASSIATWLSKVMRNCRVGRRKDEDANARRRGRTQFEMPIQRACAHYRHIPRVIRMRLKNHATYAQLDPKIARIKASVYAALWRTV